MLRPTNTNVPLRCRRERPLGKLDSCCNDTPWNLSEWKKQLYSRITNDEVPLAQPVQTLTCEVNFQSSYTETPPLDTESAHCEHVKLTQTAPSPFDLWSDNGSRSVNWESHTVEQRVRSSSNGQRTELVAVPGKTFVTPDTLESIQRDREMPSVWSDAELLAEGGLHRNASRDGTLSSHAGRSLSTTSRNPEGNRRRRCSGKS